MSHHPLALINFVRTKVGVITAVGLSDLVIGGRPQEVSTARAENVSTRKPGVRITEQLNKHSTGRGVRDRSPDRFSPAVDNHAVWLNILERQKIPHAMKRMNAGGNG